MIGFGNWVEDAAWRTRRVEKREVSIFPDRGEVDFKEYPVATLRFGAGSP
jgi:hypothetical protein